MKTGEKRRENTGGIKGGIKGERMRMAGVTMTLFRRTVAYPVQPLGSRERITTGVGVPCQI